MINLPHLLSLITQTEPASREMRAWMEEVTSGVNNSVASRPYYLISSLSDLPQQMGGVITLEDYATYHFLGYVDIEGNRLVGGVNTVILGSSSENSRLSSTGLALGSPLISSEWTLPIRHITLDAPTILNLDATGNADQALDWYGVNLVNSSDIGVIKNYGNFVASSMAFIGSSGLSFEGTFGTISFSESIFITDGNGTIINIPSSTVITRRFRVTLSAIIAFGSAVGFTVDVGATIPVEGYILVYCDFSGGGTYTSGIQYNDNRARWSENRGVTNSAATTGMFMHGNATATSIGATGVPVKISGNTTINDITQRFSHSANRLTYTGETERVFKVTTILSLTSGNSHQIGVYIAKNGAVIDSSETYITTSASGRLENGTCHVLVSLNTGDYIENFVENNTSTTNVTVSDLHTLVEAIN